MRSRSWNRPPLIAQIALIKAGNTRDHALLAATDDGRAHRLACAADDAEGYRQVAVTSQCSDPCEALHARVAAPRFERHGVALGDAFSRAKRAACST